MSVIGGEAQIPISRRYMAYFTSILQRGSMLLGAGKSVYVVSEAARQCVLRLPVIGCLEQAGCRLDAGSWKAMFAASRILGGGSQCLLPVEY